MSSFEKFKDGFFEHLGTASALVVTGLIAWLSMQIAPIVLPAVQAKFPSRVMLAILMLSIFINIALAIITWRLTRKRDEFKLLYGIFWDKNKSPHCPVCKNPGLHYDEWDYGQLGYRCKHCKETFGLKDSSGNDIKPAQAVSEL